DRHLAIEVLLRDKRVDHTVGFHGEREVEVLVGRGESLEVVGAVEPRRAVEIDSALSHRGHEVASRRSSLEYHVLEQVRHPGLAVVFHARADEIGDVDGGLGLRCVRKQQHLETIGKIVFGDALDRWSLARAWWKSRLCVTAQRNKKNARQYAANRTRKSHHGNVVHRKT